MIKNRTEHQAQDQISSQQRKQREQRRLEILTNDTYGRLLGEMERLFYHCGVKDIGFEFRQYLIKEESTFVGMMMNIEGFVQALEGYVICARKMNLENKGLPEDCEDLFSKWFSALDKIDGEDGSRLEVPKKLLQYLVGEMKNGRPITKLPDDICQKIMSDETRNKLCDEMVHKNHQRVFELTNAVHKLNDIVVEQTEAQLNKTEPIKFKRRPQLDIHKEDFDYLGKRNLDQQKQIVDKNRKTQNFSTKRTLRPT